MERAPDNLIIAKRLRWVTSDWKRTPAATMTIGQAQDAYDRGEIELCQGITDREVLLYAIPRRLKDRRRPYFNPRAAA